MKNYLLVIAICTLFGSCETAKETKDLDGKTLLNKAIQAHGGDLYSKSTISFSLSKSNFEFTRDGYNYEYRMTNKNDSINAMARTFNGGMEFTENGVVSTQGSRMDNMVKNHINNVAYYFYIPYEFATNNAIQTYLGDQVMRQRLYHKLKISFKTPEGGDPDYREFILWIDSENYEIDFMAEQENPATGRKQFSAAAYKRKIGGMLFSDFEIYQTKGRNKEFSLDSIGFAYNAGLMQRTQVKTYKDIQVTPLQND